MRIVTNVKVKNMSFTRFLKNLKYDLSGPGMREYVYKISLFSWKVCKGQQTSTEECKYTNGV